MPFCVILPVNNMSHVHSAAAVDFLYPEKRLVFQAEQSKNRDSLKQTCSYCPKLPLCLLLLRKDPNFNSYLFVPSPQKS